MWGDLPNIHVDSDGNAMADFFVARVTLAAPTGALQFTLHDQDGSAVMIHEGTDSYNAASGTGGRVACGVIFPPRQ